MNAIEVKNVTKIYPIYKKNEDRLKEAFHPFRKKYHYDFYALEDISFSIEKGETVGIIGTNGSGKSTLLKIISKVLKQTEGKVAVAGSVSSLLELGVGFDEEYSGMENIYINGSLLGFNKSEMEEKTAEIIKFADIGDFIYQPVKTYSSGMMVRLAFSLAINVEPDILIIDEALAVGDIFFQAKCFHKLEEIKKRGTTILFVSHDLMSVKKLCKRAIWIEKGHLLQDGDAGEVCEKYMTYRIAEQNKQNENAVLEEAEQGIWKETQEEGDVMVLPGLEKERKVVSGTGKARIRSAFFRNEKYEKVKTIKAEEKCTYCMAVEFYEEIHLPLFGFELETNKGIRVYGVNNYMIKEELKAAYPGKIYYIEFSLILPKLHSGQYLITPAVASGVQDCHVVHDRLHNFDDVVIENTGFDGALIELDTDFQIVECEKDKVIIK